MPQMSPLMWFELYIYFISLLILLNIIIYFMVKIENLNTNLNGEKKMMKYFSFKW